MQRPIRSLRLAVSAALLVSAAACQAPVSRLVGTPVTTANSATKAAWLSYPDAPTARYGATAVPIGLTMYSLGGRDDGPGPVATFESFFAFDKWETLKPMPTARTGHSAVTIPADRILVTGGANSSGLLAKTDLYRTDTKTWTTVAPMPTARWNAAAAGHGLWAYVAGGEAGFKPVNAFEVFDGNTMAWRKLPNLPTARSGAVASMLGDRQLAVIGGTTDTVTGVVEKWDTELSKWTTGAPMPTPRALAGYAVYGHHIFVIGGKTANGAPSAIVESYDLGSNTWTTRQSLPVALIAPTAAKLGERMVVTGGRTASGSVNSKTWGMPFPFGR